MSLPPAQVARIAERSIRPAGSSWLMERLDRVRMTLGTSVKRAEERGGAVLVAFENGSTREVDHILLGTGYSVDVARYPFLDPGVVDALELRDGYPILGSDFESSLPGLRFVGASAALSHGPLMRFISGTWHACRVLGRAMGGRSAGRQRLPTADR